MLHHCVISEERAAHLRFSIERFFLFLIKHIEEQEYCLIPMGGILPKKPQRVLGIGGTAGMVHPSTGYMISRMLGAVPTLADALIEQLSAPNDKATNSCELASVALFSTGLLTLREMRIASASSC